MFACASCGRQIAEDFRLCPYCGTALSVAFAREQRKHVTILFCNITGSTALGERTDPEALRALLARYFDRMKGIIQAHGGTVEKFIGDAVMAVFGVPVVHEDDALRAVRAAIEMREALPELGIQCRIGVNSGEVVTGTAERLATGDAVNVAARLEQAAPAGEVLIGDETYRLIRDNVEVEQMSPLELKGKSEPVPAYRLIAVNQSTRRGQMLAPMIGRERELERLRLAFAQAVDDRSCQLFTILGSAGVGKSRLVSEFLATVERGRIARGRCLSYGDGITYFPVIEVLKQLDAMPADEYATATLQSLLGERQIATSPDEIAWALRILLEEQAQEHPLIVVLDDIHWGEETFLDLVEHLADLSRDAPILLLCMARPELLEKRPGWGGGKWNATTVLLEPLDGPETDRLLDELGGVPPEMRERIRQAAEGNPFFVEEMLALIRESAGEAVAVPPTIQALLAARLDQLQPEERSVLECGSVEGRVFHRSAVQTLSRETADLHSKLLGLVRKELVRPERAQMRGDEAYRFRHLLIRDAAYEALPKATRAELHERFAGWLEQRGADLVELDEIVGYHLEQAARYMDELGQPDQALADSAGRRLARAGRQALWREDRRAARGLLARALALLRPFRWDTYLELDFVESLDVSAADSLTKRGEIAERADAAGDQLGADVARILVAFQKSIAGQRGASAEVMHRAQAAIPLLESAGDHEGLIHAWNALSFEVYNSRLQYENWAHAMEQMILHGRSIGRPGLHRLGLALAEGPRPADEALRTLDSLSKNEANPTSTIRRAVLVAMLGHIDEAQHEAADSYRRMQELDGSLDHTSLELSSGLGILAEIAILAGDHETAVEHLRTACDHFAAARALNLLSTYAPMLGRSLCAIGRYDEAEPLAQLGREIGIEEDTITQCLWRQVQALVFAHRAEYEEAERLAREAVTIFEPTDTLNWKAGAFCDLAEVLEQAGKRDEALAALNQALAMYERKKNLAMVAQLAPWLERLSGPALQVRPGATQPKHHPATGASMTVRDRGPSNSAR